MFLFVKAPCVWTGLIAGAHCRSLPNIGYHMT